MICNGKEQMMSRLLRAALVLLLGVQVGCSMSGMRHRPDWTSPYRDIQSLDPGQIVHLPTGVLVTRDELIDILSRSRIVYVGETHDNVYAHEAELEILQCLYERLPDEIAVGMEMLTRRSQDVCDAWTSGDLDEKTFFKTWVEDWANDYRYYKDILDTIREHHIPLIALRASKDWVDRVKREQTGVQPSKEKDVSGEPLPALDLEDPYHRSQVRAVFKAHPRHGEDFETFYKVQVLWDESMAQSVVEYLASPEGRGKHMLVFAGSQHVQHGFGIPRRVFRRLPVAYTVVVPVIVREPVQPPHKTMQVTLPEVPLPTADFAWAVGYKNLENQRVVLGVMIKDADDGVTVIGVAEGSAAEKAGIEKQDIITGFDGEPVKKTVDLTYPISRKRPGDHGTVEVLRDGKPLRLEAVFQEKETKAP